MADDKTPELVNSIREDVNSIRGELNKITSKLKETLALISKAQDNIKEQQESWRHLELAFKTMRREEPELENGSANAQLQLLKINSDESTGDAEGPEVGLMLSNQTTAYSTRYPSPSWCHLLNRQLDHNHFHGEGEVPIEFSNNPPSSFSGILVPPSTMLVKRVLILYHEMDMWDNAYKVFDKITIPSTWAQTVVPCLYIYCFHKFWDPGGLGSRYKIVLGLLVAKNKEHIFGQQRSKMPLILSLLAFHFLVLASLYWQVEGSIISVSEMGSGGYWWHHKSIFKRISNFSTWSNFTVVVLWVIMGILVYYIKHISHEIQVFEPFSILGLEVGASDSEIKKAYSRKTPLQCGNNGEVNRQKDQFLRISGVRLLDNSIVLEKVKSVGDYGVACFSNCSCSAYAYDDNDGCSIWRDELLNVEQLMDGDPEGREFYLRLATFEFPSEGKGGKWIILVLVVPITLLATVSFFCCLGRRKSRNNGEDLVSFDLGTSIGAVNCKLNGAGKNHARKKKEVDLPMFSFASISAAPKNFYDTNKLEEGGFGSGYKGKLKSGNEVAVKRLARRSGQGLKELINEAMLIAKLQHLERLLGCCIEEDEKILIYEYMLNKSLDLFPFDPGKHRILKLGVMY